MESISRRRFLLYASASLVWSSPFALAPTPVRKGPCKIERTIPVTVAVLKPAYSVEIRVCIHYNGYCSKAEEEGYPNMAYLPKAFEISQKIHAAKHREMLIKIRETHPNFLSKLSNESYEQAVSVCTYAWESHKQNERKNRPNSKLRWTVFRFHKQPCNGGEGVYKTHG